MPQVLKSHGCQVHNMHINFQTDPQNTAEKLKTTVNNRALSAYGAAKGPGVVMDLEKNAAHGFRGVQGNDKKNTEKTSILDEAESFDAKNSHNYMAVMSNTMSAKDFQEMKEEGYHPGRMSEAEAITGLDRIKVILSRAGVDVAGFTDTVDKETIKEITGSYAGAEGSRDITVAEFMSGDKTVSELTSRDITVSEPTSGDKTVSEPTSGDKTVSELTSGDKTVSELTSGDKTVSELMSGDKTVSELMSGDITMSEPTSGDITVSELTSGDETALKDFVTKAFEKRDLPATDDNIKDALRALNMASEIEVPDSGSIEVLLSNQKEPTIENVYFAEHSGAGKGSGQAGGYFASGEKGYYAEIADNEDLQSIEKQIDDVIERAGFKPDRSLREDAKNLIKSGIALNEENLTLYEDIKCIEFPLKAGDLMAEIAEAVSKGESAASANLIRGYNRIKNERVLNETRLKMNTEVNRALKADNGFSLDQETLSEKVDELKIKERAFYRAAFVSGRKEEGFDVEESISLAEETLFKVREIKEMPLALVGRFSSAEAFTVNDVYEAGNLMKERFEEANATYEAVGTSVRSDLGDRLEDAFKNVPSLLKELEIKETFENLRAVRILGYNSMDITEENIERVKDADQTINTLINRLTGSAVVSLIREGVNPLETSANELIKKITDMENVSEENEKFSEYLFKLERNNEISEDEAESYIGIYRLIRQIEKSDGAVIGALVNNGRELSLKNLLSELRTKGRKHMDFSIDDKFGGVSAKEGSPDNRRIDTQIMTAFRKEPGSLSENQFAQSARPHFAGETDANLGHVARYASQIRSAPPQIGDAHLGQSVFGQSAGERDNTGNGGQAYFGNEDKEAEGQQPGNGSGSGSEEIRDPQVSFNENVLHEIYDRLDPEALRNVPGLSGKTTLEELLSALRQNMRGEGFKENPGTLPEADALYNEEMLEEIREAASKEEEVYAQLLRFGVEITPENVNAMDALMNDRGALFMALSNLMNGSLSEKIRVRSGKILESMDREEDEAEDPGDAVKEAYADMMEETREILKEASEEAGRYIDLKSLKNINRQLTVAASLSNEENYEIPMELNGRLTSVNVKFIRGTLEAKAAVSFETESYGKVYGEFTLNNESISGFVTASKDEGINQLKERAEGFISMLGDNGIKTGDIVFEKSYKTDINRIPVAADKDSVGHFKTPSGMDGSSEKTGKDAEKNPAVLYKTAKIFLQSVR